VDPPVDWDPAFCAATRETVVMTVRVLRALEKVTRAVLRLVQTPVDKLGSAQGGVPDYVEIFSQVCDVRVIKAGPTTFWSNNHLFEKQKKSVV
jgi:hypothetical protein